MCDYSLQNVKSRPAKIEDRLETRDFGTGTGGFCSVDEPDTAICVLPGSEIAFDNPVELRMSSLQTMPKLARFRQIDTNYALMHHDALEFENGEIVKLTMLQSGQRATLLQLPAAPKTAQEEKEQQRLEVVG